VEVGLSSNSSVTISARFPSELIREAQQAAEQEDRSVSWLLRQSLKERLAREADSERTAAA
jgi:predicted transcriptional regulator